MKSGIYVIVNLVTLKKYVGQSLNIQKRWLSHWKAARDGKVKTKLYDAMRSYGKEAFAILTLELCDREKLNEREVYWTGLFDSVSRGYNMVDAGEQTSRPLGLGSHTPG